MYNIDLQIISLYPLFQIEMFHIRPRVVSTDIILEEFKFFVFVCLIFFALNINKNIDTVSEILLSMVASITIAY